ncbi:nuclear hormone receptor family member nhr-59 [Plakobranchus ocellatus]|uniref:Nuclear hormone receptor family member nhr-59 n=1 Tax=Plakobranchus ocellatus TaxID=259542 RepID=A0AAV4BDD3_9GAST|nr:nuclear hormone receptor family member nhr-59 [Plakobranchus ocellatus]
MRVDPEAAMHAAIKFVLPHVNITACHFHVAQSCFRRIQALGLVKDYRNPESEVGKCSKPSLHSPSLLADEIEDAFTNSLMPDNPQDPYTLQFANIVLKHYIAVSRIFTANVG